MPRSSLRRAALLRRSASLLASAAALGAFATCSRETPAPPAGTPTDPSAIDPSPAAEERLAVIRARVPGMDAAFTGRAAPARRFRRGADGAVRAVAPPLARGARTVAVALPARASAPARIVDETSGLGVGVSLEAASDAPVALAGELLLHAGAAPGGGDFLRRVDGRSLEDLVFYEGPPAREELRFRVDVTRVAGLRLVERTLELLDADGVPRLRVAPPDVFDAGGARVPAAVSVEGCAVDTSPRPPWGRPVTAPGAPECTLVITWSGAGARYPALVDPVWETTDTMTEARARATATVLNETKASMVLITGGFGPGGSALATTEMYEPLSRTFSPAPSMNVARGGHTATRLADGRIFLAGGSGSTSGSALSSTEIYDPERAVFDAGPAMATPRLDHTATLLGPDAGNRVLIAGGATSLGVTPLNTFVLFDPEPKPTGAFSSAGTLRQPRRAHAAVRLDDGRVLLTGGFVSANFAGQLFAGQSMEIYDPPEDGGIGSVADVGYTMVRGRAFHTATLVREPGAGVSHVLITGGQNAAESTNIAYLDSAELIRVDTSANTSLQLPSMGIARTMHSATLLPTGDVLVTGGRTGLLSVTRSLPSAALYKTSERRFVSSQEMAFRREQHTAVLVNAGNDVNAGRGVLILGGSGRRESDDGQPEVVLNSAEILIKPLGEQCTQDEECLSGHCTDGVCCNEACTVECYSCRVAGKEGYCSPDSAKSPLRKAECNNNAAVTKACDGEGRVVVASVRNCAPGLCDELTSTCRTRCAVDEQCSQGWCDFSNEGGGGAGGAGGSGEAGAAGAGGAGGWGGDASTGGGSTEAGTGGAAATGAGGDSTANAGGAATGAGGAAATGAGGDSTTNAGGAASATGTGSGGDASTGTGDDMLPGRCKAWKDHGEACSENRECRSKYCADGVCCNSPCTGSCEACNLANKVGECTPLGSKAEPLKPLPGHPECPGEGACAGRCTGDDKGRCTFPDSDEILKEPECACADPSCAEGAILTHHLCDGKGGSTPREERCGDRMENGELVEGGLRCAADGHSCRTSCSSDDDCIPDFICNDGVCVDLAKVGPSCDGKHTVRIAGRDDIDCTPFACEGSKCIERCRSADDCVAPAACNLAGECVLPPDAPELPSCSCRLAGASPRDDAPSGSLALAALGVAAAAAARRRQRRA